MKQPRAVALSKPWHPVQATAQQQETKRPGLPQWSGVPDVTTWPRSQPASAVSLRIPRRHVPDADSDRARLPGTGPAPRPGASQDVPGEGLTQGTINAQTGQRWW